MEQMAPPCHDMPKHCHGTVRDVSLRSYNYGMFVIAYVGRVLLSVERAKQRSETIVLRTRDTEVVVSRHIHGGERRVIATGINHQDHHRRFLETRMTSSRGRSCVLW